jgi:peptidyl-prolyl isomerase G (cyclophilin G)
VEGVRLCYQGTHFHRVVAPEFIVQAGDIVTMDGSGGVSTFGEPFEDENLGWNDLTKEGYVCMANCGPNTNTSQFFITLCPTPWLREACSVFGYVVAGIDVLRKLEDIVVDDQDSPLNSDPVIITRCGSLQLRKKPAVKPEAKASSRDAVSKPNAVTMESEHSAPQGKPAGGVKEVHIDTKERMRHSKEAQEEMKRRRSPAGQRPDPAVILKGRGAMKYREDYRTRKGPRYR